MGTASKFKEDLDAIKMQMGSIKNSRPILTDAEGNFLAEVTDSGDMRLNDSIISAKDALLVAQFIQDAFKA
jgi:hypothetical protein